ncbi:MAG TPA: ABC transporter substrate-binding protein, partial [Candidatus Lustribacter sp.]|nr:ABC transporter substrate-binding protein [Candidatus Lustribacter sp.]
MTYRSFRRAVCTLAAATALVLPLQPVPSRAADPFEINVIVSLTGPFAFIGSAEAASVRAIETLVNKDGGIKGQPVKMVIVDDQSNPSTAVQLASAIIAKKPNVMLGPTYLASCLAVSPLVTANNGPVTYCFAPTLHPAAGSMLFSGGTSSNDQARAQMTFMAAKGWKTAALIATTDATGQDVEGRYVDELNSGRYPGLKIVTHEHFAPNDTSVAAQVATMKAAKPDVIIDATVGTSTATVLRALKDAGLDDLPVMSSLGNVIHAQMDQYTAILPREIYFVAPGFIARDVTPKGPVRDAQQLFYKTYNTQGIDPDVGNSQSWDPTLIIIDALKHVGTNASPKQVLDY